MIFHVSDYYGHDKNLYGYAYIELRIDPWDDFGFKTTFTGYYFGDNGEIVELGTLKIAKAGMAKGRIIDRGLPCQFERLPENFYSLWQSAESYQRIKKIEDTTDASIFESLNDIAYDLNEFNKHKSEEVFRHSLLRFVSEFTCQNQYNRITKGEAVKTPFKFAYRLKSNMAGEMGQLIDFEVIPDTMPPSNVHVLIGRNGTGKTRLIKEMIAGIFNRKGGREGFKYFDDYFEEKKFAEFESVLCVAFSPFDDYEELRDYENSTESKKDGIGYSYIGLRRSITNQGQSEFSLLKEIKDQFAKSLKNCYSNRTKVSDWNEMVELLDSDPMFSEYNLKEMFAEYKPNAGSNRILREFDSLSSGHKVVLSIITCCVDKLAEKTILFMDEPENHLHPPLISALIRAISRLLYKRNGVGIISTHSAVILQEVPSNCAWIIERYGNYLEFKRPNIETFGENVGVLTNEIFRYEVGNSGFHKLLKEAAEKYDTYEELVQAFDGKLGLEAKSIARMLLRNREG